MQVDFQNVSKHFGTQDVLDNVAKLKTIGYVPPWEV